MTRAQPAVGRLPLIAIVGRPNVGKSALFNRLVGERRALVERETGTTRDRVYGTFEWLGRRLRLVDTGGLAGPDTSVYTLLVLEQVRAAIAEADLVLFVVDVVDGVTPADRDVAALLRESERPVILVANKADNRTRAESAVEFYELGFGAPHPVSVLHAVGIDDVMDRAAELLPRSGEEEAPAGVKVAIVGRPNVGKSMLLNAIAGEQRVIVSEEPGTTRDAIDLPVEVGGRGLVLVDTAGIRRRGRVEPGVEKHSVMRSRSAIERAEVAILVVDASEPMTAQDLHVAGEIIEAARGLVVAVNKMDLVRGGSSPAEIVAHCRSRLKFAPWARFCTISALQGTGIQRLLRAVLEVADERTRRIPTAEINALVRRTLAEHPVTLPGGKRLKVLYCTQAEGPPPTFVLFVNDTNLHFSHRRHLENVIRKAYGFPGTAIRLVLRGRDEGKEQ